LIHAAFAERSIGSNLPVGMRKSEILLSMAFVAAVGCSLWLWQELGTERAQNADLRLRLARATPGPPPTARSVVSMATQTIEQAPRAPAAEAAASPANRVVGNEEEREDATQRKLMSDPKYRDAWHEQQRVLYARRRDNLIRVVGLTAEQADAVIDLQIDREENWFQNTAGLTDQRIKADEVADQQRLGEMLGEDKRRQLQAYMETRATRMRVDDFRSELAGADALRDDQVEPLIAALQVEDARMRKEMDDVWKSRSGDDPEAQRQLGDHRMQILKATYERMHSAAAPVLTSSQLDKFDVMLKRDLDRRSAAQRVDSARNQVDQGS